MFVVYGSSTYFTKGVWEIVLWDVHRLSEKSFRSLILQDSDCKRDLAVGTLRFVGSEEPF